MKYKVIKSYFDKNEKKEVRKGSVIELKAERAEEISKAGSGPYIEAVADEAKKPAKSAKE